MRFNKILFFGIIFFLPFDGTEYLHISAGSFNISAVDIMILLSLFATIMQQLFTQAPLKMSGYLPLLLLSAIVFSLTNLAWLPPTAPNLKITCNFVEYLILFYICSQVIRDDAFLKQILRLLLVETVLLSIITVFLSLGVNFALGGYLRKKLMTLGVFQIGVLGMLDQFAKFSLFLTGALPLVWQKILIKQRWLSLVLTLLFFIAAIVTGARGLYLALSAQVMAWLYWGYFRTLPSRKKLLALVGFIAGISVLGLSILPILELLRSIRPDNYDNRIVNYSLALQSSTSDFLTFLFGFGRDNFVRFVSPKQVAPHNVFLDLLVNKGFVTLTIIVSLLVFIYYRLAAVPGGTETISGQLRTSLTISFLGMMFVGLFDTTTSSIILWTYIAIIYAFTLYTRGTTQKFKFAPSSPYSWVKL
jgi:O-antigen ligase